MLPKAGNCFVTYFRTLDVIFVTIPATEVAIHRRIDYQFIMVAVETGIESFILYCFELIQILFDYAAIVYERIIYAIICLP